MKIKINNDHFIEPNIIVKLVEKRNPRCYTCTKTWVYVNEGYPKILKTNGTKKDFLKKLSRHGCSEKKLDQLRINK